MIKDLKVDYPGLFAQAINVMTCKRPNDIDRGGHFKKDQEAT